MKIRPILFINVPWMEHYQRASKMDKPQGSFAYTKSNPLNDHTQFNFKPYKGNYYGHVPGSTKPHLKKLGAVRGAEFVDGVTVVWIATEPSLRGRVIVGWYGDARVWGERQEPERALAKVRTTAEGEACGYTVEATVASSRCINPGNRPLLPVHGRSRKGKPGQNPFWYGNPVINRRVLEMMARDDASARRFPRRKVASNARHGGWLLDARARREIEDSAMIFVMKTYARDDYTVKDVSAKNLGYDVLATSRTGELHLEVKGSKGLALNVELTPNEFSVAKRDRNGFRLCVVLETLSKHPKLRVFRPKPGGLKWYDEFGSTVRATKKVGAVITE